jgi:hypothetical protein
MRVVTLFPVHMEAGIMRIYQLVHRGAALALLVALILGLPMSISAQEAAGGQCAALVEASLSTTGSSCANQEPNSACYGNNTVDLSYFDPDVVDVPWEPGARTDLTNIADLTTQGADLQDETWGVTVLNSLANIPRSIDSGLVTGVLGGIELHNLVTPEAAFEPLETGVTVTTVNAAEMREATMTPPAGSDVLGTIPAGQSLVADAVSQDGQWARVVFDGRPVWVPVSALDAAVSLATLPVFGPESFTPMQDFCMGNPRGGGQCGSNAPSLLILQSPSEFPVDARVQGTNLRIQGTITLRMSGNQLELIVINGIAVVEPDTADEVTIPAGFAISARVGQPDVTGCAPLVSEWSEPRRLTSGDLNQLAILEDFPDNLLNDPIILPEIVQPSGVGQPRVRIVLRDPVSREIIPPACEAEEIEAGLCEVLSL